MTLRLTLLILWLLSACLSAQYWSLNIVTGVLISLREAGERFLSQGLLAVAIGDDHDLLEQLPHALDDYGVDYDYHEEGLTVYLGDLYKAWRLLRAGEDIRATMETLLLMDLLGSIRPTQERVVGHLFRRSLPSTTATAIAGPSPLWKLPAVQRGVEIEILRAGPHRLPHGFPVVDILRNNVAISVKSIDIRLAAYQSNRLYLRLKGYVDKLAKFDGATWDKKIVIGNFTKELEIVIPKGTATPVQRGILDQIIAYGRSRNIPVKIIEL